MTGMEIMGTSCRRVVGIVSKISALVADYLATLISFLLRDWQYFHACLIAPLVPLLIGF